MIPCLMYLIIILLLPVTRAFARQSIFVRSSRRLIVEKIQIFYWDVLWCINETATERYVHTNWCVNALTHLNLKVIIN
jgi:hypothetical protein